MIILYAVLQVFVGKIEKLQREQILGTGGQTVTVS
jgi:hypothetical protein